MKTQPHKQMSFEFGQENIDLLHERVSPNAVRVHFFLSVSWIFNNFPPLLRFLPSGILIFLVFHLWKCLKLETYLGMNSEKIKIQKYVARVLKTS